MKTSSNNSFDVIVVGSGPGGASVAWELAGYGRKVLILEWGNNTPINGTKSQTIANVGILSKNILFTQGALAMVRATTTGGSSVYYYATAFDPPVESFKKMGIDISTELSEIKMQLPIGPLKDELVGPMARKIMNSAKDLGYLWEKLPKFVYQDKCKPDCWRCNYGCPYGAKWNARMLIEKAQQKGAKLINNAKVTNILYEHNKIKGVEFKNGFETHKVYASQVVLSAGGIGTPVILRNSGFKDAGYDFFYDPLIAVMGTVKDLKGGQEFPMACGLHLEDEQYMMTDMTVPALLRAGFAAQVFRFDRMFSHEKTLTIMIKAKDDLGGCITDRGGVRKPLTPEDKLKLLSGYDRAKAILKNAGAKNVFKSWYIAAHPGGTVKIGQLLDTNLQTRIENLFVCDCSVIPRAWGMPPTLTLLCLGKRLARYMAGQNQAFVSKAKQDGQMGKAA